MKFSSFVTSRFLLACFVLLVFPLAVQAVETELSADQILARLSQAMRQRNYQGVLTYEHGGKMETMHTAHLVLNGIEYEQYSHLNGPERNHARAGRQVNCETLGGRLLRGTILSSETGALGFKDYYKFYLKGYDRVAGRQVAVVQILPKDNHRYGMSLGVDVESGILLKFLIMLPNRALERTQFVAFELDPAYSEEEQQAFLDTAVALQPCAEPGPVSADLSEQGFEWLPAWQPPGFVRASSKQTQQDGIVHTYTDGLSSYSVFINPSLVENAEQSEIKIPQGIAQRGATLVVMSLSSVGNNYVHVALVGEVPQQTAGRILKSIARRRPQAGVAQPEPAIPAQVAVPGSGV